MYPKFDINFFKQRSSEQSFELLELFPTVLSSEERPSSFDCTVYLKKKPQKSGRINGVDILKGFFKQEND